MLISQVNHTRLGSCSTSLCLNNDHPPQPQRGLSVQRRRVPGGPDTRPASRMEAKLVGQRGKPRLSFMTRDWSAVLCDCLCLAPSDCKSGVQRERSRTNVFFHPPPPRVHDDGIPGPCRAEFSSGVPLRLVFLLRGRNMHRSASNASRTGMLLEIRNSSSKQAVMPAGCTTKPGPPGHVL